MTEATEEVIDNGLQAEATPEAAVEATPEGASAVETPSAEPELDLGVDTPVPKPEKQKVSVAPKWAMERINENQNKADRLAEELARERREKEEAKAILERLQGGNSDRAAPTRQENVDIDALVEARAAKKLFDADCNAIASTWQTEAPDTFKSHLDVLSTVGVLPLKDGTNTEFMEDILAVDRSNAHKILESLAQDPERALSMRNMSSKARIAALTRMQMTEATKPTLTAPVTPTPKPSISRVPPPKPVLDAVSDDLGAMDLSNDKLSDSEWSKLWNKRYLGKKSA